MLHGVMVAMYSKNKNHFIKGENDGKSEESKQLAERSRKVTLG